MIEHINNYKIFYSDAQTIVNFVSLDAHMETQLQMCYAERYPRMQSVFLHRIEDKTFTPGKLLLIHESDHEILMLPIKYSIDDDISLELLYLGLQKFKDTYKEKCITSIVFPDPYSQELRDCIEEELKDIKDIKIEYLWR